MIGDSHIVRRRNIRLFSVSLLVGLVVATLAVESPSVEAHGFFDQCNTNTAYGISSWTRSQARSYAGVGAYEGYHWGGGCWDNDNVDDQPNDPVKTYGTHGEGGDCSGFTFKSWALTDPAASGYHYWPRMHNEHGPYTAAGFKAGSGPALSTVSKSSLKYMDALASSSHIGMIYALTSNNNTDSIIEARGESYGTGIWTQTYRASSSYTGVRRAGGCQWDGTCS